MPWPTLPSLMLSSAISVAAIATSSAMIEFSLDSRACSTASLIFSSRSPTVRRHAEPRGRVAHEVDLDEHRRLVTDDPPVVPRLDRDDLRRGELQRLPVAVARRDRAARDEADVRVHADLGADGVLHVRRPAEAGLVDHALDAAGAGRDDVHLDAADDTAVGSRDRR